MLNRILTKTGNRFRLPQSQTYTHAILGQVESYSQTGEDLILRHYLDPLKPGFYVDVGAHHPYLLSNTYYFYRHGWRGINIDAMPGSMKAFCEVRPKDINIEIGIAKTEGELTFFTFSDPELNTFDAEYARQQNARGYPTLSKIQVNTAPLGSVLEKHLPHGRKIEFLSIDIEGFEQVALETNDWSLFNPIFVLVECHLFDFSRPEENPIYRYMQKLGYVALAKTNFTFIFGRKS